MPSAHGTTDRMLKERTPYSNRPSTKTSATLWNIQMANIFFAGDGLSFATGWIQGALESGLRAAFQFYIRNEGEWPKEEN